MISSPRVCDERREAFEAGQRKATVTAICNLVNQLHATVDEAMDILKVADEERHKYLADLGE